MTARAFAIVSAAMYDAYNSIERMGAPFLVRVQLAGETDSDAAVAQAAHDTLVALFPSQQARFDAALDETFWRGFWRWTCGESGLGHRGDRG